MACRVFVALTCVSIPNGTGPGASAAQSQAARSPAPASTFSICLPTAQTGFGRAKSALTEAGLSDEYGVSKTPVREAFVLPGHEGFVEPMPRIGDVAATFTVQDVLEAFHLRSILEAEAAGLAAERITEEGIAALLKNSNEEVALSERAQKMVSIREHVN